MRKARPSTPRVPKPLDRAQLDTLALAYVARFATSRAKLARYLERKRRERGWDDPANFGEAAAAVIARCDGLGFVDDGAYAAARGGAMMRRGLGDRRIAMQLNADGIAVPDAAPALQIAADAATHTAIAFARRRRLGPFGPDLGGDRKMRERQFGAMVRAGHGPRLARTILAIAPGDDDALAALDDGESNA